MRFLHNSSNKSSIYIIQNFIVDDIYFLQMFKKVSTLINGSQSFKEIE